MARDSDTVGDVAHDRAQLIADCDLHFRKYREYLLAERPGGSYEAFLRDRAIEV